MVHKKKKEVEGAIYLGKDIKRKVESKAEPKIIHTKGADLKEKETESKKTVGGYNNTDGSFRNFRERRLSPNVLNVCQPNIVHNYNNTLVDIPNGDDFFNPVQKDNDYIPNGYDFFVSNEIMKKEIKTDAKKINFIEKQKRKSKKKIIGQKTLSDIKDYFIKNGSLDVLTCEQIFKVKSLHNFIWHLRKEGLKIKTDKVGLSNELGEKVLVTNYRLIPKK